MSTIFEKLSGGLPTTDFESSPTTPERERPPCVCTHQWVDHGIDFGCAADRPETPVKYGNPPGTMSYCPCRGYVGCDNVKLDTPTEAATEDRRELEGR